MENKLSLHTIGLVAKTEYVKWITNPRMIVVPVFCIFIQSYIVEALNQRAARMNDCLSVLEPFAALGNSRLLVAMMPLLFLILISDYPIMDGSSLYVVQRCGRINWCLGQLLFLCSGILTFLTVILGFSVFTSGGRFSIHWSDAVTKYQAMYPEEAGNFSYLLLSSNLYNQLALADTVLHTFILTGAYLLVLSLMLYLFKLHQMPAFGFLIVMLLLACGTITCVMTTSGLMWLFPVANTQVWLHYTSILEKPIYPIWCSYLYFGVWIVLAVILNLRAVKRIQFTGQQS